MRYLMMSLRRFFTRPLTKMSDRWKDKKKLHLAARSAYLSYKIGKEDSERLLQIAALEMKAEKYNLTIRYLEEYLELNLNSKKALLLLGIAYRRNKDYEKAIKTHLKCLKKGEEESDILYTLGIDYERAGKIRTTKRYYAKCIEIDSSFAKAYFRLARLYMRDKKYDLAVNLYLDGLSLREGSAKDWINLSFCYINTSNLVAAEKVLLEALENFPDSSEVLFALGAYYIKKQKYNKIPEIISKLDSEEDWYIVLSLQLKEVLDKKEYEELEKLLEQIKKEDRNAEYWYM
ncbi:MAG: tetratricopeptide repeat protein, partial [Candidatus Heimdallarchaeota archaeon]